MHTNLDIWRTANVLVQKHGEHAAEEADKHLAGVIGRGDAAGAAVWRRVLDVIPQPLAKKPNCGAN